MPEIRVIEPIIFAPAEKLRVCAYARVSSDSTDQRNSFASQVNYYTKYIQAHEGWTFVDIYADQGITGTSALKRDEFLRLMRDCRQGKIDRILVKSVSRFARNAQDCIEAVIHGFFSHFSVEIPRNKLQNLWKLTTFHRQQESQHGQKPQFEICCKMKNMLEMCCCKKPILQISSKRR